MYIFNFKLDFSDFCGKRQNAILLLIFNCDDYSNEYIRTLPLFSQTSYNDEIPSSMSKPKQPMINENFYGLDVSKRQGEWVVFVQMVHCFGGRQWELEAIYD